MAEKPAKKLDSRTTLDNLHQIQIGSLQKEKGDILQLESRIQSLSAESEKSTDIVMRSQLDESIQQLQKKKDDLASNKPVYDYFFETGEILYNYYDLQDKIQSGRQMATSRLVKAKPGSVLAALQEGDISESFLAVGENKPVAGRPQEQGREVLLEKYLLKVNPEHAKSIVTSFEDPHGMCDTCDKEMTFSANEALFFCDTCGHQEFVLIDSDKPSYKDPPREVTYYAYKRINHFNEWLAQFQAKESTEIPEDIFQAILEELKKERITNPENIKPTKVREILKKLKCTNFYEHVPYILNRINGKNAPVMSREIEEKLRLCSRRSKVLSSSIAQRTAVISFHIPMFSTSSVSF
jgi:hypothetical protein